MICTLRKTREEEGDCLLCLEWISVAGEAEDTLI